MMTWQRWTLLIFFFLGSVSQIYAGEIFSATVKKIIDGDSLLVVTARDTIEVRLYGVDCPEYDQPYSRKAKTFTKNQVLGKQVLVEPVTVDAYGRTVAIITRGETVLNKSLVQSGLAWVYPRYCKKAVCASWKKSERTAREKRLGLWQDDRPDPPWQWKKRKRS